MGTEIVRIDSAALAERVRLEEKTLKKGAHAPRAANTLRAHKTQWSAFEAWCSRLGYSSCPAAPAVVAAYANSLQEAGRKVKSIELALSVISTSHQERGHASPVATIIVRNTMKAIRLELGVGVHKKRALFLEDIDRLLKATPPGLLGMRDRALLAIGFLGAFRRSELAVVHVEHIERFKQSIKILIPRSKTNQEGKRKYKTIPNGVGVTLLDHWLVAAGIETGPVFRGVDQWGHVASRAICGKTVADVVKRTCKAAGLDPSLFSGHSLRSGFVSEAKQRKKPSSSIMGQTGHSTEAMVNEYDQHEPDLEECAAYGMEFDVKP